VELHETTRERPERHRRHVSGSVSRTVTLGARRETVETPRGHRAGAVHHPAMVEPALAIALFPTPIVVFDPPDMAEVNRELAAQLLAEEQTAPSRQRANVGGWHYVDAGDDLPAPSAGSPSSTPAQRPQHPRADPVRRDLRPRSPHRRAGDLSRVAAAVRPRPSRRAAADLRVVQPHNGGLVSGNAAKLIIFLPHPVPERGCHSFPARHGQHRCARGVC
jgi:hypothetical protein